MITEIGQANHVFENKEVATLTINTIDFDEEDLTDAVTIRNERHDETVMIHSLAQREQMDAFVREAFDDLEG